MKWLLLILIIICGTAVSAQNTNDTAKFVTVTKGFKIRRSDEVKTFAYSINHYIVGNPPPNFLLDECFELDNLLWTSFHPSNSVRWEILQHVTNKDALKALMQSY